MISSGKRIDMTKCAVCNQEGTKRCSKCKSASYCCAEHQKTHWKEHKAICKSKSARIDGGNQDKEATESESKEILPNELVTGVEGICLESGSSESEQPAYIIELLEDGVDHGGLYMFANKDLNPGDIVLEEKSAVICPLLNMGARNEFLNPCWGCCESIWAGKGDVYRCNNCGLSLCSTDCESAPIHKQNECRVIKKILKTKLKRRGLTDSGVLKQYLDVCVLRFLIYQNRDPKVWEEFQRMVAHSRYMIYMSNAYCGEDVIGKDCKELKLSMAYTGNNSALVLLSCQLLSTFWEISSFGGPVVRALYCVMACIQHDCVGNTFATHDNPAQKLTIRASVPIKKGDLITTDFLGNLWASTACRREALSQKHIICNCIRCSDKTELNTFSSAFLCSKCDTGLFLPVDFDPDSPSSGGEFPYDIPIWKCNRPICGNVVPHIALDDYLDTVKQEYSAEKENPIPSIGSKALKFYNKLCYEDRMLAPTHSLILEIMDDYLQEGRNSHELTNYLEINSKTTYMKKDVIIIRRKREFSHRLMKYLDQVKKDCIHMKKCCLYTEYGFYNLVGAALDYKEKIMSKLDLIKALEISMDLWKKVKDMMKYFAYSQDASMPDYRHIARFLYSRFQVVHREEKYKIQFLMAELQIEDESQTGRSDWKVVKDGKID